MTFSFFTGVLVFRLAGSPTQPAARRGWWCFAPVAAVLVTIVLPASTELRPLLDVALVTLVGPAIIWMGQAIEPPRILVRLFSYLGGISYAVYVLHVPIVRCIQHIAWRLPREVTQGVIPFNVMIFFLVIIAATLADRFYDAPVRAWLGRKLKGRRPSASPPGAARAG